MAERSSGHPRLSIQVLEFVDARVKPGHDEVDVMQRRSL